MEEKVKPKWIWEDEFCRPWIQKAKDRDIKLTGKNREKLGDAWLSWVCKHFGLSGMFKATYGPHVQDLIQRPSTLLSMIRKEPDTWTGPLFYPVPLDKSSKE